MKIKINPMTVILIAIFFFMKQSYLVIITYIIMFVHELAHFFAAVCIGLKAECISFEPFGVHLMLKNRIIRGFADEIILYSAGPLINGIFAIISLKMDWLDLYKINIALFIMNMLPVLPLDGGIILRRVISHKIGKYSADLLMKIISGALAAVCFCIAMVGFCMGYVNPSLFIMAIFLVGNLVTGNELYNVDFIDGISNEIKRNNRTKIVIVDENNNLAKAAKKISTAYTTVALITDKDGRVCNILTDKGIQKSLLS